MREALVLGSGAIDTEHILLGLSRQDESLAMRVLTELDAELPSSDADRFHELALEIRNGRDPCDHRARPGSIHEQ